MNAAAAKPASNRVRYGARYPSRRQRTARRVPPTSAWASRTGPATPRSYSWSAPAPSVAVSSPAPASSTKRTFSIARRWRCVYRTLARGRSPKGPSTSRTVLLSPGTSRTVSTSRRSKESILHEPSLRSVAVAAFVGPTANHRSLSAMASPRSAMAYSCTGSPPQTASIRSRKAAGMRPGWSVYRSMIRLSCVRCDMLFAGSPKKEIGPLALRAPEGRFGPDERQSTVLWRSLPGRGRDAVSGLVGRRSHCFAVCRE